MTSVLELKHIEWKHPELIFQFELGGRTYFRTIGIGNLSKSKLNAAPQDGLNNIALHIGLALARYFLVIERFNTVHVACAQLDAEACAALETWYQLTLAEFLYRNQLPLSTAITITSNPGAVHYQPVTLTTENKALLMNGGGKDSALAGELMKSLNLPFSWIAIEDPVIPAIHRVCKASGVEQCVSIQQTTYSQQMLDEAIYDPCIPETLVLTSLLVAYVENCRYLVMANEYSANQANHLRKGKRINHQVGKSLAISRAYQDYAEKHIVKGIEFFSVISPLYEIQIAKMLLNFPAYMPNILSCNIGLTKDEWCGKCPKCAFTFLIFAAFKDVAQVKEWFGFDPTTQDCFWQWIESMIDGNKPFDCVGTHLETLYAMTRLAKQLTSAPIELPALGSTLVERYKDHSVEHLDKRLMQQWKRANNIPLAFAKELDAVFRKLGAN